MAVAVDASSSSGTSANATTLTWSHTCAGANRYLVVGVNSRGAAISGVTYAGVAMTRIGAEITNETCRVSLWRLFAPASGAGNVVVTAGSSSPMAAGAVSFNGAHQTTVGSTANATGTSKTPSVAVSSAAGQLVVDVIGYNGDAQTAKAGAGQTQRYSRTGNGSDDMRVAGSTEAGATSTTMSWSITAARDWVAIGVGVLPATAAAVPFAPAVCSAYARNRAARVCWTQADDQGTPITGYTVTASPGGATVAGPYVVGTPTTVFSVLFPGLANGTSYTFTVTASNAVGTSAASGASNAVTPGPWDGGGLGEPRIISQVAWASQPRAAVQTYTDVSAYLRRLSTRRGRQRIAEHSRAGTCSTVLSNGDRRFDPDNASGPHYPLKVNRRVRHVAMWPPSRLALEDATFETSAGSWVSLANATLAWQQGVGVDDQFRRPLGSGTLNLGSLKVTAVAAGDVEVAIPLASAVAVDPSTTWTTVAHVSSEQATYRSVSAGIRTYTAAGAVIATTYGTARLDPAWVAVSQTVTGGGTTAKMVPTVKIAGCAAGEVHYIDVVSLHPGTLVDAGIYPLYSGYLDSIGQISNGPMDAEAELEATDLFKILANAKLSDPYLEFGRQDDPTALAWYRMNDVNGSLSAIDVSGSENHGDYIHPDNITFGTQTLLNPAFYSDGAAAFKTSLDGRMRIPKAAVPTAPPWSMELWLKTSGVPPAPASGGAILSHAYGKWDVTGGMQWQIYTGSLSKMQVRIKNGPSARTSVDVFEGHSWYVVLVAEAGQSLKLYVDGALATTGTSGTGGTLLAGDIDVGNVDSVAVDITLDEIAFHNYAMSASEVAGHNYTGQLAMAGNSPGNRVDDVGTLAGLAPNEMDLFDESEPDLYAGTALNVTALEHMFKVEETSSGLLFINNDGVLTYVTDESLAARAIQNATFSDRAPASSAALPYSSIGYRRNQDLIYNVVRRSRENGGKVEVRDQVSVDEYGEKARDMSGMLEFDDQTSAKLGQRFLAAHSTPRSYNDGLSLDLSADASTLFPEILSLDIGAAITVERTPQGVGSAISQTMRMLGINLDVVQGSWSAVLYAEPI